ncbi:hypothetical protein [Neorhizobium sp. NCHU2750]|uniref:hypothetical protein n=1 Tax=Neorhizobium sp. NCHU2750 TaxID=1825976 RepID=UPI000E73E148|nr:hypothetical protein NCHU2750_26170 [Neorhizobium sp. NCHU2750]
MADFVAVIRRAVDGLATNTPEARERVYEKARGAVQRQLENMKPRPPEEMLRRQLDKLEAAIASVETEHSEALPAEPEVAAAVPREEYHEPAVVEQHVEPEAPAPVPAAEPVAEPEAVAPEPVHHAEVYQDEEPVEPEPVVPANQPSEDRWPDASVEAPVVHEPPSAARYEEPEAVIHSEVRHEPEPVAHHEEPKVERYGDWRDDVPAEHADHRPAAYEPEPVSAPADIHSDLHAHDEPAAAIRTPPSFDWPAEPATQPHAPQHEEPAEQWAVQDHEPVQQAAQSKPASSWDEVDDLTRHLDQGYRHEPVEAHFSPEMHAAAQPARMPAASSIPDAAHAVPQPAPKAEETAEDPFEAYVNAQPAAQSQVSQPLDKQDERDPWSDLEDLIGYNKDAPATAAASQAAAPVAEDDFSDLLSPPAKPYRVTPVRKRNYMGMILGLVALLIVAGGAYGVWMYRGSLNDMFGGLIAKSTGGAQTATQTPAATTPATPAGSSQQTAAAQPQQNASTPAAQHTPPPADGAATGTKFTQRLQENGSEVDAGPGDASSLAQNAEGQSVAQLNTQPATPSPATPGASTAAQTPAPATAPVDASTAASATPAAPAIPPASPSDTPAVSGEKIFLYEERIGQSAPTAIDGTVSWSLQHEASPNGGPPEAEVQGRITVPGRGLTALLTLKRNNDPSLPASHLIEIVFAVPPDFEGGAIDSVLRIAMKSTEQDRGNALVAVPAKITDDFHMIALNDFPDAEKTNLDLLKTRNWIDIPLAYRNGRRALLTLQKGPDGQKAFDDAMREWAQAGPAKSSN